MVIATGAGKLTLHEFIGLVERHPERKYRLDAAGGIVEMSPGWVHGKLQFRIGKLLDRWLERGALPGYAVGTEVLHDLDGWLCIPDVVVQLDEAEPFPRVAPRLAVEIRSESNPRAELRAKARRYLEHGTQMVWLVYPETRALELYCAGAAMQTLSGDEVIAGGAALPRLRLAVNEIFPQPPRANETQRRP